MKSSQLTILHIEDDPNDVLLIERAFRNANVIADLKNVCDGEQAANYLAGRGAFADRVKFPFPALLLLDLKLPRRSGLELISWVRSQEPPLRRMPVVVLTSSNQPKDVNRAYEAGANSYVVKPTGFDELTTLVKVLSSYWLVHTEKPEMRR